MSLGNAVSSWGKNAVNFLDKLIGNDKKTVLLPRSMGGFVFSILEEVQLELKNNITTHYLEDGSNVQQNISNNPKFLKLKGFVLELELKNSKPIQFVKDVLHSIDKKVSVVDNLLGNHISPSMKRIYNKAQSTTTQFLNKAEQLTKGANNFLSVFENTSKDKSKVEQAYNKLEALWASKVVFDVFTFGKEIYKNMTIVSLSIKQTGQIENMLDVIVELQEIKMVHSEVNPLTQGELTKIERVGVVKSNTNVKKEHRR